MKNKKKLVFVSHTSEISGGAEMSMLELVDKLKPEFKIHFIIRKPHRGLEKILVKKGVSYDSVYFTQWAQIDMPEDPQSLERRRNKNNEATKKIKSILKNQNPDVVVSNTTVVPWGAIAAKELTIPHVWYLREYCDPNYRYNFTIDRELIYKDIDTLSDLIVTNSSRLKMYIDELIDSQKAIIIHNVMNIEDFQMKSKDKSQSPFKRKSSIKLISVGRIKKSKGQILVMRAMRKLIDDGIDVELCIVGTPSNKEEEGLFNDSMSKLGLVDRVTAFGHSSNPGQLIAFADVGLTISDNEAFGRTTIEYLAMGKPVIGHRSGATQDIIEHNKTGLLIDDFEPKTIAKEISKYALNKSLLSKHSKHTKNSLSRIFSKETSYIQFMKLIQNINHSPKKATNIEKYQLKIIPYKHGLGSVIKYTKFKLQDLYLNLF